jgi:hypothetical protein
MTWWPAMDKRDPRLSASIRGYDSDELFRKDLWLRRIADSRRKHATIREDLAIGAHTASVKRSNATLELLKEKIKLLEMEETKEKALMLADLIASREVLLFLTVDEATEELRGLLNKLDAETQKKVMERICSFLD